MMIHERKENGETILSVRTEKDFHEALKRELPVELPHELADQIGLMVEDVGTDEEIEGARNDPYE